MKTLDDLKVKADVRLTQLNHAVTWNSPQELMGRGVQNGVCDTCGKKVYVRTEPKTGPQLNGEAIRDRCG